MGLCAIVKELDRDIQREYTRIGRKIPDKHLYETTTLIGFSGGVLSEVSLHYLLGMHNGIFICMSSFFLVPDNLYNIFGLTGRIKENNFSDSAAVDPFIRFFEGYNRRVRFPIFLTGAFCLGKGLYDMVNSFVTGEPLNPGTNDTFITGVGFLGLASSMYLKDQNPRLLEKKEVENKLFSPAYASSEVRQ